jgi:hypothetical protein
MSNNRYPAGIAGHRHQGQCRQHQHSGIQHFSPVPEHSGSGLGPLIPVSDCSLHQHLNPFQYRTDRMPYSPAFKNIVWRLRRIHPACGKHTHTADGGSWIHSALPYSRRGKGYTFHIYTTGSGEGRPHCRAVDGFTLHVHTAGCGKSYTLHSTLLAVKRDTPCTSTLQRLLMDTPCNACLHCWR